MIGSLMGSFVSAQATAPAMADNSESVEVVWSNITQESQPSGSKFDFLASISCLATYGQTCNDMAIAIPYDESVGSANGETPISQWLTQVVADEKGLLGQIQHDEVNNQWIVPVQRPIVSGEVISVVFSVTPPNFTTSNNTLFELPAKVSGSNLSEVVTPKVASTVTATSNHVLAKTVSQANVLNEETVTYTLRFRETTANRLGTLNLTDFVVKDILPDGLDFIQANNSGTYDETTREVTWPQSTNNAGGEYTFTAKINTAAELPTTIKNTANVTYNLLGEDSPQTKTSSANVNVLKERAYGDIFSKQASGNTTYNLGSRYNVFKESDSDLLAHYLVSIKQHPEAMAYKIVDPMPCLDVKNNTTYSSGAVDYTCENLAFKVKNIYPSSSEKGRLAAGADMGQSVKISYVDGTTETIAMKYQTNIPVKEGAHAVELEGNFAGGASNSLSIQIQGSVDDSVPAESKIENVAHVYRGVTPFAGDFDQVMRANLIVKEAIPTAISSNPRVTTPTPATNISLNPAVSGAALTPEQWASGKFVLQYPEGFSAVKNHNAQTAEENWMDSGRDAITTNDLSNTSTKFNTELKPGVYTYDIYVGYPGVTVDEFCRNGMSEVSNTNTAFVDTTGIIGEPGVPTTVCKIQGQIVLTANTPSYSIDKHIKLSSDSTWLPSPGLAISAGDVDADFKITWANVGNANLRNGVVYDMLPAVGDKGTVGELFNSPRNTSNTPTLTKVNTPEGWNVEYSKSSNPCRPEVMSDNATCDDDWSSTAPADLAEVTALKWTQTTPSVTPGYVAEFTISMNGEDFNATDQAWNSASAKGDLMGSLNALAPAESSRVGFGRILESSMAVEKQVCSLEECEINGEGWVEEGTIPFDSTASWKVTVTNTGGTAIENFEVTDELAACVSVETQGALTPGKSFSFTCSTENLRKDMTNTVEVSATDVTYKTKLEDSDTAKAKVGTAPLSAMTLIKEVCDTTVNTCLPEAGVNDGGWSDETNVLYGVDVLWRVTLTNTGAAELSNVAISDEYNEACSIESNELLLLPGQKISVICEEDGVTKNLENTAKAKATTVEEKEIETSSTAKVNVTASETNVKIIVEVCAIEECSLDSDDGWVLKTTTLEGEDATWRITVLNDSLIEVQDIEILSEGNPNCKLTLEKLSSGESSSFICKDEALENRKEFNVTGTYTNPSSTDQVRADAEISENAIVEITPLKREITVVKEACFTNAPLSCEKWEDVAKGKFNANLYWKITVTNSGEKLLNDVAVIDKKFPLGSTTIDSLKIGESKEIYINAGSWSVIDKNSDKASNEVVVNYDGGEASSSSRAYVDEEQTKSKNNEQNPEKTQVTLDSAKSDEPKNDSDIISTNSDSNYSIAVVGAILLLAGLLTALIARKRAKA